MNQPRWMLVLGLLAADCGACAPTSSDVPDRVDAARAAVDAGGEQDSASDAQVSCSSAFVTTPTCTHPLVTAECRDGWCRIPHGCFVMGAPDCQWGRALYAEQENQVTLTHDFEIGETEVTQALWLTSGFPNPSTTRATHADCLDASCPVGNVTWFDALAFANRLSEMHDPAYPPCYRLADCTGTPGAGLACGTVELNASSTYECPGYRLPTEAEWEYAARAGTRTPFYSGNFTSTYADKEMTRCDPIPALERIAWYCANAPDHVTRHVRTRDPNAWGLFDMIGNAYEWVSDPDDSHGYGAVPRTDPGAVLGLADRERVRRGGSVTVWPTACNASARLSANPKGHGPTGGFRLARTVSGAPDAAAPDGGR